MSPAPGSQPPQASLAAAGHSGRRRRSAVLAAVMLALVGLAFSLHWTWGFFDLFSFQPHFADTVAILAAGQARHAGLDVYAPNPFDPMHRQHVYGPGWLVSGAMGLTVNDAPWIGALLVIAFIGVAAVVLAPPRWRDCLVALALLCSPPVMLGIDRANNDLVVFILLAGASWLLTRRRSLALLGGGVVGLAATLKMYPFAALPVLALRRGPRRNALLEAAVVSAGCVAVLWIWRDDYRQALAHTPNPETIFAYGLRVTGLTWHALAGFRHWFITGLLAGAGVGGAALASRVRRLWAAVPPDTFSGLAFLAGAACWIFCFVAAVNFPYRFVLLLLPARFWLEQAHDPADHGTARTQLWLWALVGWLEVPKQSWSVLSRPDVTITTPAWKGLEVVCGFEQGLATLLTLALGVAALGAFVRHGRGMSPAPAAAS